jgi:hypothetical protein
MSEQADIEAALARATAAYKNVSAERDALKDASDRAAAAEAERDRLREALDEALEGWTEGAQYKGDYLTKKHGDWERIAECRKLLAKEAGQ